MSGAIGKKTLVIAGAPHITSGLRVDTIMFHVVVALLPVCAFAVFHFGSAALLTLTTALLSCLATEHVLCRLSGKASTLGDWSAVITGLLYGLTLPPSLPLWMTAAGGAAAIGVGKFMFGGLGCNPFNPALVGRAVLQASFPAAMTSWPDLTGGRFTSLPPSTLTWPLTEPVYDAVSGATPLTAWKFGQATTGSGPLFLGTVPGSTGETCALLIVLGGLYLAARRMLDWRVPAAILLTVASCSSVFHWIAPGRHASPGFMLFSGGLMLGAIFMATDMVGSPLTRVGRVVYGVLIGVLVVVIRAWGGMPEGVMYAVLLGNAATPLIDTWVRPTVFGTSTGGGRAS